MNHDSTGTVNSNLLAPRKVKFGLCIIIAEVGLE